MIFCILQFHFPLFLLDDVLPVDALSLLLGLDCLKLKLFVELFDDGLSFLKHTLIGNHVLLNFFLHLRDRCSWVTDSFSHYLGEILQRRVERMLWV